MGANSRLGAYSNKYGKLIAMWLLTIFCAVSVSYITFISVLSDLKTTITLTCLFIRDRDSLLNNAYTKVIEKKFKKVI